MKITSCLLLSSYGVLLTVFCAGCGGGAGRPNTAVTEEPATTEAGGVKYTAKSGRTAASETAVAAKPLPSVPKGGPGVEALEAREGWEIEQWENTSPGTVHALKDADGRMLYVAFEGSRKASTDKVAIGLLGQTRLASRGRVTVDVHNPSKQAFRVAFAVGTSEKYDTYEAPARMAGPGWTRLRFGLAAANYKSAASGWKYSSRIQNGDDTRKIMLIIYNGPRSGGLFLDGISVPAAPAPPPPPPAEKDKPEADTAPAADKRPPQAGTGDDPLLNAIGGVGNPKTDQPGKAPRPDRRDAPEKQEKAAPEKKRTQDQEKKLLEIIEGMGEKKKEERRDK